MNHSFDPNADKDALAPGEDVINLMWTLHSYVNVAPTARAQKDSELFCFQDMCTLDSYTMCAETSDVIKMNVSSAPAPPPVKRRKVV